MGRQGIIGRLPDSTMRVETRFAAIPAGSVAAGRRAEPSSAFALAGTPAQGAAAAATQTGMLAGLDAILTLQGDADTPQERRRRTVQRGHDLLDGLDRLKVALLGGRVATRDLRAIAGRLGERSGTSGDPRLDALMADIELRAAVELAKLEAQRGT